MFISSSKWKPIELPSSPNVYPDNYTKHSNGGSYHGRVNANTIVFTAGDNSKPIFPTQIQLPLQRPNRQLLHRIPAVTPPPIISPPKNRKSTAAAATKATTSDILRLMDGLGLPIPVDIYTYLAKECTASRDPTGAIELHAHVNRSGLRPGLLFCNRILLMYVSCGLIDSARHLFDTMPVKDCNSWAAMIAGYIDVANHEEAINLFIEMRRRHQHNHHNANVLDSPDSWIIVSILKACVHTLDMGLGKQIHGWLSKINHPQDLFLSSSLINLYGKFGCLEGVDFVFDHLPRRNTVVWTAKIVYNCREEHFDEALAVFKEMGREGVKKNGSTFSTVLRACGRIEDDGQCGRQVHASAIKLGLESNDFVHCGLVDMYAKCGLINNARMVFETRPQRTSACWNAMLMGYIQGGHGIEAIKILYAMKAAGLQPQESLLNEVRFTCGSRDFVNKTDAMVHSNIHFEMKKLD
ncbi:hypothetical protein U1Q18_018970 [Sarracenia purpurea var. burkii]